LSVFVIFWLLSRLQMRLHAELGAHFSGTGGIQ